MDSYFTKVLQEASPKVELAHMPTYVPSNTTKQFLRFIPGLIIFAWLLLLVCFPKSKQVNMASKEKGTGGSKKENRWFGVAAQLK